MIPIVQPLFAVSMKALIHLRHHGTFGTPDDPFEFEAGATVPWWIECRWPISSTFVFLVDCESYWDVEWQVVRPLWRDVNGAIMRFDPLVAGNYCIHGAPTLTLGTHRPKRRLRVNREPLRLALQVDASLK